MAGVTPMTAGYGSGMSHLALSSGHSVSARRLACCGQSLPRSQARMAVLSRTSANVGGWALSKKRVTTSGGERIPFKNPGKVEIRKIGHTKSPSYQRTKLL